jgi:ribonuclease J
MYKWIRPEIILPVHGEMRHMAEQERFARAEGVPKGIVQSNGDLVRLAPDGPVKIGTERAGRLILDGDVILPADGATMNERRKISANGVIAVSLALDDKGRLRGEPAIALQGVPVEEDKDNFVEEACLAAAQAVDGARKDETALRESIRLAVRRTATSWTGKKPVVEVSLIRI